MSEEAEIKPAELLRPEDLLENAKYLLDLRELKALRAVVLESMTALEVYVHNRVFKILETKFDPKFVKWFKKRTQMNFDDRLGYITPFAINKEISQFRQSDLWRRYKNARELRNDVTHDGIKISFEEAEEVYKTVYDWLACLESSAGLELSLYKFRQIIEGSKITSIDDYFNLLTEFYLKSKAGFNLKSITQIKYQVETAFEWGLKFGQIVVSLDTKFSSGTMVDFNYLVETVIGQTKIKLNNSNIDKAAIIIFHKGEFPESYNIVRNFDDGKIYIIAIKSRIPVHIFQ